MKILLAQHPGAYSVANTDSRQLLGYQQMREHVPDLEFAFSTSRPALAEQYLKRQASRVVNRLPALGGFKQRLIFRLGQISWLDADIDRCRPDVLVSYGQMARIDRSLRRMAVFHTGGLMTDKFLRAKFGANGVAEGRSLQITSEARKLDDVDIYHSHSTASTDLLKHYFPEHAEKFVAIPFFIGDLRGICDTEFSEKWSRVRRRVVFVGNQARRKRLDVLLEAWTAIAASRRDAELVVVSNFADGPVAIPDNQNISVRQNLSHAAVIDLLRSAHFYFMASDREAYGLVFVEAMASGCAILCADTEVQREIVVDNGAGLACDPTEFADVVDRMRMMLEAEKPEVWAQNGRRAFNTTFAPAKVAQQYASVWKELASRKVG